MTRHLSIVLLVDNETPTGLVAEHGFAAWIDTDDECFLFDTGQGAALEHNARALGADLSAATALILSHGHYDHTGGLPTFLAANWQAPILYGKGATQARFSCHPEQTPRAIGMTDDVFAELERLPAERRIELEEPRFLRSGIGITGPVPRITDFEDTGGPFFGMLEESKQISSRTTSPCGSRPRKDWSSLLAAATPAWSTRSATSVPSAESSGYTASSADCTY